MQYFLDTVETIPQNCGFSLFGSVHITWILVFILVVAVNCLLYKGMEQKGRTIWKRAVAGLIILDEIFKVAMLLTGKRYNATYLPLHLCSINIFIIAGRDCSCFILYCVISVRRGRREKGFFIFLKSVFSLPDFLPVSLWLIPENGKKIP